MYLGPSRAKPLNLQPCNGSRILWRQRYPIASNELGGLRASFLLTFRYIVSGQRLSGSGAARRSDSTANS